MGEKQGHTPGPWERDGDFFEVCRVEFEGSGSYTTISSKSRIGGPVAFAVGTPDTHWRDDAEQDANARLIAAAPDLLEALEEFSRVYDGMTDGSGEMCPTLLKARYVIAAATGDPDAQ